MKIYLTIVAALLLVIAGDTNAQDFRAELYDTLFTNYSRSFLPHHEKAHYVNISMDLQFLQRLDLFQGAMVAHVFQTLIYKDERLQWDPAAFGSIHRFHVSSSIVWVPDISIWNSASTKPTMDQSEAILYPDGTIVLIVPMFVKTSCGLDLSDFPYDSHNCSLQVGSWTNDNTRIVLTAMSNEMKLGHFEINPIWHVVGTWAQKHEVVYPCCEEVYEDVTFSILISRRESHGRIGTAVVSAWLILAVFFMQPSKAGERIIFSGFVLVSLVVLSAALSAEVPAYSVTRLGRFLLAGILITAIVVVFNGVIYRFYPTEQQITSKGQTSFSAPRAFFLADVVIGLILFVVLVIATGALFS